MWRQCLVGPVAAAQPSGIASFVLAIDMAMVNYRLCLYRVVCSIYNRVQ